MNQLPPGTPNPAGPNVAAITESPTQTGNRVNAENLEKVISKDEVLSTAITPNVTTPEGEEIYVHPFPFLTKKGRMAGRYETDFGVALFFYIKGKGAFVLETMKNNAQLDMLELSEQSYVEKIRRVTEKFLQNEGDANNLLARLRCIQREDKVVNTFCIGDDTDPVGFQEETSELALGMGIAAIGYKIPWGKQINDFLRLIKSREKARTEEIKVIPESFYNFD